MRRDEQTERRGYTVARGGLTGGNILARSLPMFIWGGMASFGIGRTL